MEIKNKYSMDNQLLYKFCILSNKDYLSIILYNKNSNDIFSSNFNREDLILINPQFHQFNSINSIMSLLSQHIDSQVQNINISTINNNLKLTFLYFMGEKTISFILYPSLFQTRLLTIIKDNNGKIIKQNRYNNNWNIMKYYF